MARENREHLIQVSIIEWASRVRLNALHRYGHYKFIGDALVASGNGIHTSISQGSKFKASGGKAGFPDLQLTIPVEHYHGLFIELKVDPVTGKQKGKVSPHQKVVISDLNSVGYLAVICFGFDEVIDVITMYLGGNALKIRAYLDQIQG